MQSCILKMVMDHFFLVILQACSQEYLQIVESFGDSADESCPFSIHNLLEVGSSFGLAAGSWLGPYALCRTLEALAQGDRERHQKRGGQQVLPMVVHVVSGDAGGCPSPVCGGCNSFVLKMGRACQRVASPASACATCAWP